MYAKLENFQKKWRCTQMEIIPYFGVLEAFKLVLLWKDKKGMNQILGGKIKVFLSKALSLKNNTK